MLPVGGLHGSDLHPGVMSSMAQMVTIAAMMPLRVNQDPVTLPARTWRGLIFNGRELPEPRLVPRRCAEHLNIDPMILNPLNLRQFDGDADVFLRQPQAEFDIVARVQVLWL